MLGAPLVLAGILALDRSGLPAPAAARVDGACSLGYMLGWGASAWAMRRLRLTGTGRAARALQALQLGGIAVAALWAVAAAAGAGPSSLAYRLTDPAWPLSHLLMAAVGVAVARAGRWAGWRRWAPLACGLVFPAVGCAALFLNGLRAQPGAADGRTVSLLFGLYTALAWTALGYAVRTTPEPRRSA